MRRNEKKKFDFSVFMRIFSYVKPYKTQFVVSIILALILAFFSPVRPLLIQYTIDKAIGKNVNLPFWLEFFFKTEQLNDVTKFIVAISIFQLAFLLIEATLSVIFSYITSWMGQTVVRDMRKNIFEKIMYFNLRQFDRTPIGTLTTRTVNDIESINNIFSDGFIPIVADLLSIIVTLATMLYIDWRLTIVALLPFPLLIVATYYFKESVNKSFIMVRNAVSSLNAFVQEHIAGMSVVQAFASESKEAKKFTEINKVHRDANIRSNLAYSIFFPVVEIILAISVGIIIWYIAGKKLEAGLLVSFIMYINQIFRPLRVIADKFNTIQMGMIAGERVFAVMDNPDMLPSTKPGDFAPKKVQGKVDFNHVTFAYVDELNVLKNVDFHIQPGEVVALVGHTGSGKTSIISLLNRLYEINKGEILIDDVNIKDYDVRALRKNIGVVLQDVFLFSGSVKENITLRNPKIPLQKVEDVAKMIGVHDFIMQLPDGYNFNVRERGNTLSMGQRQLISFIRALLYNPSILILDEATSSVDSQSEMLVQHAIDKLITGRTSIVIAHRLSTIRKADRIILLDKGEIKETGTHQELLALKGRYYNLYNMQLENSRKLETQ